MQNQGMLGHGNVAHLTGFARFSGWYIGVQIMVTEMKLVARRNCSACTTPVKGKFSWDHGQEEASFSLITRLT